MSWIKTIDEQNADETLKNIYTQVSGKRGRVANILKIHSLMPETMKTHLDLYMSIMFGRSKLNRQQQEMIAVVVSAANKCEYCINHHAEALNHYWKDKDSLEKFRKDYRLLDLKEKELCMLAHARKLTLEPHKITENDINRLQDNGFSDEEILNINLVASYFNFVNRIALGLGVQFSDEEKKGYKY